MKGSKNSVFRVSFSSTNNINMDTCRDSGSAVVCVCVCTCVHVLIRTRETRNHSEITLQPVKLNKQKSDNRKYWLVCGATGTLIIVGRNAIRYNHSGLVCLFRKR